MREDLAALTPETVAALSNMGLVKRATKELEAGKGPRLDEAANGTVSGTFEDGSVATLPPGVQLKEAPCTCGAPGACRHKVGVALAYRAWVAAEGSHDTEVAAPWTPADFTDEALASALGRRTFDEASAWRRRGVVVGVGQGDVPSARLPTCTVRFLVPRDLAYARCDCEAGGLCAHVAIAVWAFREAGGDERTVAVQPAGARTEALGADEALALGREVLLGGAAHAGPGLGQRLAVAAEALVARGWAWPGAVLEDLQAQLEAYAARSARYSAGGVARLLVELEARTRALAAGGELPAGYVLGQGEAPETRLDLLRLVALGARIDGEARTRRVRVVLADSDTGTALVLDRAWEFGDGEEVPDGPALARRRVATVTLSTLAAGQVVTKAARRRANRQMVFGSSTGGAISVTPQDGDWGRLPTPLRVDSVAELLARWAARPPRVLRPRVLAEDFHVLPVAEVVDIAWEPGTQTLRAVARDVEGGCFDIVREFRAATPRALDRLAAALGGALGPVRFVAGEVRRHGGRVEVEPSALACDRVVVPDLEDEESRPMVAIRSASTPRDPMGSALSAAASLLEEAAHLGLRDLGHGWPERAVSAAAGLVRVGLATCAHRLTRASATIQRARLEANETAWTAAASAWAEAALRLELARELA